jgi:hypothetical protein
MAQVYQSRWGYHPCAYATYLQLKQLNRFYLRALRRFADWQRWQRKQPQNRVYRRIHRNDRGQVIGCEVIGPRPEPMLCPVFTVREKVHRHRSTPESDHPGGESIERVSMKHTDIPQVYRNARLPVALPELVVPLPYSPEEVTRLIDECRKSSMD